MILIFGNLGKFSDNESNVSLNVKLSYVVILLLRNDLKFVCLVEIVPKFYGDLPKVIFLSYWNPEIEHSTV